jgi:selenocysteine lyase/cysteine desulfurase
MEASLSLIEQVGMARIAALLADRIAYLDERLRELPGWQIVTPPAPDRRAGIVTIRAEQGPETAATAYRQLMAKSVVCANRGGGLRLSPHWYTPFEVLDRGMGMLSDLAGR